MEEIEGIIVFLISFFGPFFVGCVPEDVCGLVLSMKSLLLTAVKETSYE